MNKGGLAAAAAVVLFLLIVVLSVLQFQLLRARGRDDRRGPRGRRASRRRARRLARLRHLDLAGLVITLATLARRVLWAFPLYWGLVTTFKPEYEVVRPGVQLWPQHFTFENYVHVCCRPRSASGM